MTVSLSKALDHRRAAQDAPFLAAARGDKPSRRPVWMMRQAGRSLPEYRDIRRNIGMLDSCFHPEILHEITMQPVRRHDADAAILFSDIVVPLKAAGMDIEILPGKGPVTPEPIRSEQDLKKIKQVKEEDLLPISKGIASILEELSPQQVLIGFAGAPFTLASYLVEGGSSKNHEHTKALMHSQPELWHELMRTLTPSIITFLRVQLEAGVDAIQLFDSWAGFLRPEDYRTYVAPYSTEIFESIAPYRVPMIHFGVGTGELLADMSHTGATVMGVDWRVSLEDAAQRINNPHIALQGNLDPALLYASKAALGAEVQRICAEADRAIEKGLARGHIFNLGHGVLPNTDPDVITETFAMVHEL